MPRKYKNPPVLEAICEFQFDPDSDWDIAVPGLVYEELKDTFPIREQVMHEFVIAITAGPKAGIQPHVHPSAERIRFLRKDKKALVQVGPHLLAVNHLRPYPTWEMYLPFIERAYKAYRDVAQPKSIKRIELRYINQIEIPSSSFALEDYFQFYPYLGEDFPDNIGPFIMGLQIAYNDDKDALRVQLANAPAEKPDSSNIILDLDYSLANPQAIGLDDAFGWLRIAHDRIEQIFEASLTDKLRQIFQEESK